MGIFTSLLLCLYKIVSSQESVPAERSFQLHHYTARISFDPYTKLLKGEAEFEVSMLRTRTDSLVFSTPGMEITSVNIHEIKQASSLQKARFARLHDDLVIYPGFSMTRENPGKPNYLITIVYSALAPKELHLTGWDDTTGRMRKQLWAHRPSGWIPFVDQMCTQDILITFDKKYLVVANGERIDKKASGDTAICWHYRLDKPHPFYSVCFVAGDYRYKSLKTSKGLPLELWYYPEYEDRFNTTYALQKEMFDFFESETGFSYPYSLYRNIPLADYLYGAMETTTSTVYADFLQVDKRASFGRNYLNTNAHELAHQWFGNCINDKTVDDLWLTESFATYFAKIFERKYKGELAYEYQRELETQKALKIAESNNFPLGSGQAGVERWYQKGSLVMDMMRDVVGDTEFKAAIHEYIISNAYAEAESNDLLKAIYKTSGKSLNWFFKEWIHNGGEPEYKVSWKPNKNASGENTTLLHVEQLQLTKYPDELFKMPVNIETYYSDESIETRTIWVDKADQQFEIPNILNKTVSFVVFDAGNRILKKLQYERSFEALADQLIQAKHVSNRLEALRAMQAFPFMQKRKALTACYARESYPVIKAEVLSQLAKDSLSDDLFHQAIHDKNAMLRKSLTDNIKIIPPGLLHDYETLLKDSSYFIVESALINLCETAVKNNNTTAIASYLDITRQETGWRGRNIRTAWLGIALGQNPENKEYLAELKDYTSPSFDFETRLNALNQFKKLNYLDADIAKNLNKAASYWNPKLSGPAKEMISYFSVQEKYKELLNK